jgi:preprotein translocase subunit Sec61beta
MANDGKISMPGGMGGLMRYDEEYGSKFMLSPTHVIIYIVVIILFVLALKAFWPIA